MKIKCWRNMQNCLLFLSVGFLMLSNPLIGKAQNNPTVNLSGTEWKTEPTAISTTDADNSTTTVTRYLYFKNQGRVESLIDIQKSMGMESEYVTEYENESYYDYGTGRYETRSVPKQVRKTVRTPPKGYAEAWKGTYEIKGKTVYLDFPICTIEATVSGDSLKGVATYKDSKKKESWILSPSTSSQNNSSSRNTNSGSLREDNKYSVPVDSPIIGTWKYEEGCTTRNVYGITSTSCKRTSTFIYSQDGIVQSFHVIDLSSLQSAAGNWKYNAENETSGVLEEFKDGKLVEKGNVRFLGKSQLQYTITFSPNSDSIGKTYIWNKQ